MKKILQVAALVTLGATAAQADGGEQWLFEASNRITAPTGEAIYATVCTACHQADGKGAVGAGAYPTLTALPGGPDYPMQVVMNGQAGMPPFGGILDDNQVAEIVNYIRTNFGNTDTENPATAEMAAALRSTK